MKYLWTTIHVKDMKKSLEFYQKVVGLPLNKSFSGGPDMEFSFLGHGQTQIELICDKNVKEVQIGKDISLGFEVESVDKMMDFVKQRGIDIVAGPISPNEHVTFFFVEDPNGVRIQFVENM